MSAFGLCKCGCGQPTPIAKRTRPYMGHVAGQPTDYISGHNRLTGVPMPKDTRDKIAAKLMGHPVSAETRDKMRKPGPSHPRWNGGRLVTVWGYIEVWIPDDHPFAAMRNASGRVREHRLVMAEHLGRVLTTDEVVHHINGQRDDNRLENLSLFTTTADHSTYHHALRRSQ